MPSDHPLASFERGLIESGVTVKDFLEAAQDPQVVTAMAAVIKWAKRRTLLATNDKDVETVNPKDHALSTALRKNGIYMISELQFFTSAELHVMRGLGPKRVKVLIEKIAEDGYRLLPDKEQLAPILVGAFGNPRLIPVHLGLRIERATYYSSGLRVLDQATLGSLSEMSLEGFRSLVGTTSLAAQKAYSVRQQLHDFGLDFKKE